MARKQMPVEDFVREYVRADQRGLTIAQLAKRINRSVTTVYLRQYHLRRAGVRLPVLRKHKVTVITRAKAALEAALAD